MAHLPKIILVSIALILASCGTDRSSQRAPEGLTETRTVAPGELFRLPENYVRKNTVMNCTLETASFDSIRIGRGEDIYMGFFIDITRDSLRVSRIRSEADVVQRASHGLRPDGKIEISIVSDESDSCSFTMSSGGRTFSEKLRWWAGGEPYVRNTGCDTVTATLSFTSADLNRKIWIIGDSYISWQNPNRWPYHIYGKGHRDWMADHLPGGASPRMLECFRNDLRYAGKAPAFVVWTLGMNDRSDKDDQPDAKWLECMDEFLATCAERGIKPVIATIPSVPSRNHNSKNDWVRASGIRYIDFAEAVDPDGDAQWEEGMLFQDGVHPSEKGAEALADRFLEDFPEIMKKSRRR